MSTEGYSRVLWLVLDGMGFEHVRLALASGKHPALARIDREGCFVPMRPASPVCQTPPALLALFSGTQPAENGVWGYYMPHPVRLQRSMSGFHADVGKVRTLWQELEERGVGYSLMNVAFRNDPVWRGPSDHLAFGYDGYRLWRKPSLYRLAGGTQRITWRGIELRVRSSGRSIAIAKGSSRPEEIPVGGGRFLSVTTGVRAYAHLLERRLLLLNPVTPAVCRGSAGDGSGAPGFVDMSTFHLVRRLNSARTEAAVPVEAELHASLVSFQAKADLMVRQADNRDARLVLGYFPVIDDFSHAYLDLLLREDARAVALFHGCVAMVDALLRRLMDGMGDDELLAVSSDHGAMEFHSVLHVNEVFADAGLVRRRPGGYDYSRSLAWYHPSDCGQVVTEQTAERGALLRRIRLALEEVRAQVGIEIGMLDGGRDSPFLAFLYPKSDGYFTGRAPRRGASALDRHKSGGHHLSPLSPGPWIHAALGLWSPRRGGAKASLPFLPRENTEMKRFVMESLELS